MKTTTEPFEATKKARSDQPFSEVLKQAAGDRWKEATHHRFVQEIATDTIPDDVMRHYLIQDHVFVDALTRLVARGVAAAPGMEQKRRLSQFLQVLTSDENDFFERSFDALKVGRGDREDAPLRSVTLAFEDLFRAAVEEYEYSAVIVALLPVEWTYHEWASWAKAEGASSQRFWVQEWVDMHSTKEFGEFVDWLKSEADEQGARLDDATKARLLARFVRAVELEAAFFTDAYASMP